jgi:AcrR family transcriptional regulator
MKNALKQTGISRPNSDGKRELIIEAALKVMVSDGLFKATTRKIAEAAGVNLATLHYHFSNKEDIFFQAMEVMIARYHDVLDVEFSQPQNLHDRIHALLHFIWREIEKAPGEQLALQEMTLYLLRHPDASALAAEKDREFLALYHDMLLTATDAGEVESEKLKSIANFIYTAVVGLFNQWLSIRDTAQLLITLNDIISSAQTLSEIEKKKRLVE